jgi:alkylhydroperoxidase family enzyme
MQDDDGIQRGPGMKPMFLPDVERNDAPSPYANLIKAMRESGQEYPQIWHMFAFLPKATEHLARFTQEILRGPAPLSPGLRELIAARTSYRNDCPF